MTNTVAPTIAPDPIARSFPQSFHRRMLAIGVSLIALSIAVPAGAQSQPSPEPPAQGAAPPVAPTSEDVPASAIQPEDEAQDEQIVVTGTRIARDGYEAPTPLTVLNAAEIEATAPANVADFVNDIPSIVGSATPATSNASISAGTSGVNSLNLRGLGATRTLVLLNGQRSVGSIITGAVDVNTFPQGLIRSVEIVTGGASAAYGSDAVSGVVNFILDTEYDGIKGSIERGVTTYGDDGSWRVNLTAGVGFAGDRGRILLNGEFADRDGIFGVPRGWNDDGWYLINNPAYTATNGLPEWLIGDGIGLSNSSPGGIITNTPLRGTVFGEGGAVSHFNYGVTRDPWMIGGDWRSVQVNDKQSLHADERRHGVFGRVSFVLSDAIEVFAQASYNRHASLGWTGVQFNQGNVVIQADNAFLPADIRARFAALGIRQFNLGTTNADLPIRKTDNEREVERYVAGAGGAFDALGTNFKWDAYYQRGITRTDEVARDITNNARLALAQDAVFAPDGSIICRSTRTNPGNGCVPFNRMGINVNSQAALDYILGNPARQQRFQQDVAAANLSFDAFDTWAGTVSLATGIEHRREKVSGEVEPQFRSGWFVGNYLPTFGKYDVTEGYLEAVVPLAKGLEFNGAVRATDYSTSGYVTTWKAGVSYSPIPDIRLRATRSRDIRAPNLSELFVAGTSRTNTLVDPFSNNASVQFLEITTGNLDLRPEKADSWGVGAVVQPRFVPGLGLSVDYYDIKLDGAIGAVSAQTIVDRCFQGVDEFCGAITRGAAPGGAQVITQVSVSPFNFATLKSRGLDFEASYRTDLSDIVGSWNGTLSLRAVATRYLENYIDNGIDKPTDTAGENFDDGPPDWLYRITASYAADPWTVTVIGRGVSAGTYSNAFVECTSACPPSTIDNRTINDNKLNGAFYVDTSFEYGLTQGRLETELFLSIQNLFNRDPEIVPWGPAGTAYGNPATNQVLYDILGRVFRVGARFKFN